MKNLIIANLLAISLCACNEGGGGGSVSTPINPTPTPVTPVTQNPQELSFTAKSPAIVGAKYQDSLLTITGTGFDSAPSPRTIGSIGVRNIGQTKVCNIQSITNTQITCYTDPNYVNDDSNQGYAESTESWEIYRILDDSTEESVSIGNVQFKKKAHLTLTGNFALSGVLAANSVTTQYFINFYGAPANDHVEIYTLTNDGQADVAFSLQNTTQSSNIVFYTNGIDCPGTGNLYSGVTFQGTLAAGASCQIRAEFWIAHMSSGVLDHTVPLLFEYLDNTGNSVQYWKTISQVP